jgi:energy-coupling factor transporter ATP-binding protein EcfA2
MPKPSIENENTFRQALLDGVNLFVGSGFSVLSKDEAGRPLPVGPKLADELCKRFELEGCDALDLAKICTIVASTRESELDQYLRERFTIGDFDPRYSALENLAVRTILTTNIDDLPWRIYADSKSSYLHDLSTGGSISGDRAMVEFVPLHGSVRNDGGYTFTALDLAAAFSSDPDEWHFLTERLQTRPTLFWGYSLSDAGVLEALHPRTVRNRSHEPKWIVLRKPDAASEQFFRAMGFAIIVAETADLLDYLGSISTSEAVDEASDTGPQGDDSLASVTVPTTDIGVVRPIIDFYMGAEPTWHDIFSGQLHQTAHVSRVIEAILSKKHVMVVGVPACGKSTLLMQVSVALKTNARKLIFDSITNEKAEMLLRKLNGAGAVVFIDNFADSISAVQILVGAGNVQVVGADREYNFEIASHRIERYTTEVVSVTDLADADAQQLFKRIPDRIRSRSFRTPRMAGDTPPSIFESVQLNVVGPTLRERYRSVLQQLAKRDPVLRDLFLMCCYVHSCRTPVSHDMVSAFLRNDIANYTEAVSILGRLHDLVTDYTGSLVDTEQDHFIPRSNLVSEACVDAATSSALREVLLKFHRNVSIMRVCRFDIFRRRAYDADLAKRAFPDWEQGKAFYESVYDRLHSPYILQQGALYLSHKKRYREAFNWIDKAVTDTSRKVLSIRNSHAIILFRANISLAADAPMRRDTLRQSMDILSECYQYDRRKTYHALVFADQAMQYWDAFGGSESEQYLRTASQWLAAETKASPWNRRVGHFQRMVDSKVAALAE